VGEEAWEREHDHIGMKEARGSASGRERLREQAPGVLGSSVGRVSKGVVVVVRRGSRPRVFYACVKISSSSAVSLRVVQVLWVARQGSIGYSNRRSNRFVWGILRLDRETE